MASTELTSMLFTKLRFGVLRVVSDHEICLACTSATERLRLLWLFRNFHNLPEEVLSHRDRQLVERLISQGQTARNFDEDYVIGTLERQQQVQNNSRKKPSASLPTPPARRHGSVGKRPQTEFQPAVAVASVSRAAAAAAGVAAASTGVLESLKPCIVADSAVHPRDAAPAGMSAKAQALQQLLQQSEKQPVVAGAAVRKHKSGKKHVQPAAAKLQLVAKQSPSPKTSRSTTWWAASAVAILFALFAFGLYRDPAASRSDIGVAEAATVPASVPPVDEAPAVQVQPIPPAAPVENNQDPVPLVSTPAPVAVQSPLPEKLVSVVTPAAPRIESVKAENPSRPRINGAKVAKKLPSQLARLGPMDLETRPEHGSAFQPTPRLIAEAPRTILYPEYPAAAWAQRKRGTVVLKAQIGAKGRVTGVQVLSGEQTLAAAARRAVSQWRYAVTEGPAETLVRFKFINPEAVSVEFGH